MRIKDGVEVKILLVINFVLVIAVAFSLSKTKSNAERYRSELEALKISINQLEGRLGTQINNAINGAIAEFQNQIRDVDYTLQDIDIEGSLATVEVTVSMKSVRPNGEVFLVYQEVEAVSYEPIADTQEEVLMSRASELAYKVMLDLNVNKNYQYHFLERPVEGGEAMLSSYPHWITLYDRLFEERVQIGSSGKVFDHESIEFDADISIDTLGYDELGLNQVDVNIRYDDQVIKTLNATHALQEAPNYGYTPEEKSNQKNYRFIYKFMYDQYPDLDLSSNSGELINMEFKFTFKDGFEWTQQSRNGSSGTEVP